MFETKVIVKISSFGAVVSGRYITSEGRTHFSVLTNSMMFVVLKTCFFNHIKIRSYLCILNADEMKVSFMCLFIPQPFVSGSVLTSWVSETRFLLLPHLL